MAVSRTKNTNKEWVRPTRDTSKPFTQVELQSLSPGPKLYTLFASNGLAFTVTPAGSKLFRYYYRTPTGQTTASLGKFPHVSLKDANLRLAEIQRKRAAGIDPNEEKRQARAGADFTFEKVARAWWETKTKHQKERTSNDIWERIQKHVLPKLGRLPIAAITAPMALPIFEAVANRGHVHSAKRILQYCKAIAKYAIRKGLITINVFDSLREALPVEKKKHHAAITEPKEFGRLLAALDEYQGDIVTRYALQLAPLFFLRSAELRCLKWSSINWDERIIEMQATDKKEKRDHIIPLCTQALRILHELKTFNGDNKYILASSLTGRPLSDMTLNVALRRLGFSKEEMTTHGFRAAARTMLAERLGYQSDHIELQSARKVVDGQGNTYNRAQWLDERTAMMQRWADYCDERRAEFRASLSKSLPP